MTVSERFAGAIKQDDISGRLWLYSNYHCNLACRYCLTESSPSMAKRELGRDRMVDYAQQALRLGFTGIGITGGEPFMLPYMTDVLKETSAILPVTILTNGTLFNKRRLQELQQLVDCDIRIQLSLDHPDPIPNDQMRGKNNFDTVVEVIPRLKALGLHVRIATTVEHQSDDERMRLQQLVHSLGIPTKDHVIRKIVSRGRAVTENLGFTAPIEQLMPELTISTVGAFWSPFGPTFKNGSLQTDLLISKTTYPLVKPLNILLDFLGMVPRQPGDADGFV